MRLSVLITYHNEGPMLRDCLETLAGQDIDEVLIYDDASSEPPQRHIPSGLQVEVIRGAVNRGPSFGRNVLVEHASGDLLHFHDADDWFHPEWARRVVDVFAASAPDAVFTEVSSTRGAVPVFDTRVIGLETLVAGDLVEFCLRKALLVPAGTYTRDVVRRLGMYDTRWSQSEDFDFHLRLALCRPSYEVIPQPLVCIRRHTGNRSTLHQAQVWRDGLAILERHETVLLPQYAEALAETAASFASRLFAVGELRLARRAYERALGWGHPAYEGRPASFARTARLVGPYRAEYVALLYRRLLPSAIRAILRRRGQGIG